MLPYASAEGAIEDTDDAFGWMAAASGGDDSEADPATSLGGKGISPDREKDEVILSHFNMDNESNLIIECEFVPAGHRLLETDSTRSRHNHETIRTLRPPSAATSAQL